MQTALARHQYGIPLSQPIKMGLQITCVVLSCMGCVSSDRAGEVSEFECRDGEDNDHDGMKDCADPGCRGTLECLQSALEPSGGNGPTLKVDSGQTNVPHDADASKNDGGTSNTLDASDSIPDGGPSDGAMPNACPTGVCASGKICEDGTCVPGAKLGASPVNVHITIKRAEVPWARLEFGRQILFDFGDSGSWAVGGGPDPYIVILLKSHDANLLELWQSTLRQDTFAGLWNEPGIDVELTGDDELVFEARDYDGLLDSERIYESIFSCSPGFPASISDTPSEISCGGTSLGREHYIRGMVQLAEPSNQ